MSVVQNINGLTADSRNVKNGYLFAAFKGEKIDGRDHITQAIANGATHILAQIGTAIPDTVIKIESDNPRRNFALLCAEFYGTQPDNIIAITGTNGKTSVADFIRQIFEMMDLKSASLGTLGLVSKHIQGRNVMTTPDPVTLHRLMSDLKQADVNYMAMEASSHGLDQHRLDGVKPMVAAFTNLTQDHLDYHGDMDNYFTAKSRLFIDILDDNGMAVLNADDEWIQKISHQNTITFGKNKNASLRLISQTPTHNGQDIKIQYGDKTYDIHLPLIGLFQAYNILCATACCIALGLGFEKIIPCLPKLKGVAGRVELAFSKNEKSAYIDYAHTPDALEKVLTSLRPHVKGRLICVFGAGGDRDKDKRPKMGTIVAQYADIAIVTDDNPRGENADDIRAKIITTCPNAINIGNRREAIKHGVSLLQHGDILLVAGKGHEQGQMVDGVNHPFNDLTVTKELS